MTDPVDIAELVGQLRAQQVIQRGTLIPLHLADGTVVESNTHDIVHRRNPDGEAAADLIEQQAARLEALSAEREGMREALERLVFAADAVADTANIGTMDSAIAAARAALSPKEQDNG